jgi:hypothetical protein
MSTWSIPINVNGKVYQIEAEGETPAEAAAVAQSNAAPGAVVAPASAARLVDAHLGTKNPSRPR